MKANRHTPLVIIASIIVAILGAGTLLNPDFWSTPDQRGDALMKKGRFAEASKTYRNTSKAGIALYRDGQFENAANTFARVPGRDGFYNAGNAWLMHGQYDKAIERYDRALDITPGWKPAEQNQSIAAARRDSMTNAGKDRDQESADAYNPDKIVTDNKGGDEKDQLPKKGADEADDTALQATWLRRVKTTPAQFLRAKFAWQAQTRNLPE